MFTFFYTLFLILITGDKTINNKKRKENAVNVM